MTHLSKSGPNPQGSSVALADIQRHVGVAPDGKWGPNTAAAVAKALGMKVPEARAISQAGVELIKQFEGLRLEAYPDPATGGEPWTIGVGHTGGVRPGDVITEARADDLLRQDVTRFEQAVAKLCPITTQPQFDALVSFAFNVGEGNLKDSTLRRLHNEGNYSAAAGQFERWNKANGKVMTGLTRRRAAEASLYRSGS